jgi:hypothetical protein
MNLTPRMEHGLLIFMVIVLLIPCALAVVFAQETPYHEVPFDPAEKAVLAEGFTVTGVNATIWNIPGAIGGRTYTITRPNGETFVISTQAFDSTEARDAAIRQHNANTMGRGRHVGGLIVHGQYIISVTPVDADIIHAIQSAVKRPVAP